jgi:hypothetical protein
MPFGSRPERLIRKYPSFELGMQTTFDRSQSIPELTHFMLSR